MGAGVDGAGAAAGDGTGEAGGAGDGNGDVLGAEYAPVDEVDEVDENDTDGLRVATYAAG